MEEKWREGATAAAEKRKKEEKRKEEEEKKKRGIRVPRVLCQSGRRDTRHHANTVGVIYVDTQKQ